MTGLPALLRESALLLHVAKVDLELAPPKRHGAHLPAKMDRVAKALERAADELEVVAQDERQTETSEAERSAAV